MYPVFLLIIHFLKPSLEVDSMTCDGLINQKDFEESKEDCDNDTDDSSEISKVKSDTSIEDVNLNVTSDDSEDDIVHHTTF